MGFMTRFKPQCEYPAGNCREHPDFPVWPMDDATVAMCGCCSDSAGIQYECTKCGSYSDPQLVCAPCYQVEVTLPPILFEADAGCPDFTTTGGTATMDEGEKGGLICNPSLICQAPHYYHCTWGAVDAMDQDADIPRVANLPLTCCNEVNYCDSRDNEIGNNGYAFVGSVSQGSGWNIGCFGAGGCETRDYITKLGVWVAFSVGCCNAAGGRGNYTIISVRICPFLRNFDCYTNFDEGFGGGGDVWEFNATSSCVAGCGCARLCETYVLEGAAGDEWEIPNTQQARSCVGCTGVDVPAVYRVDAGAIGDGAITLIETEIPCEWNFYHTV